MLTQKITEEEIKDLKISSLPSRPTAPLAFGGKGYTAKEMKEAFDKLPLLIVERFNSLMDDICSDADNSVASAILTPIGENYTVTDMCNDIASGTILEIISYENGTLADFLSKLRSDVDALIEKYDGASEVDV